MSNRNSKCSKSLAGEISSYSRDREFFLEDMGHELGFERWVILELVQENHSTMKSHMNRNTELSHKNSLSRTTEVGSGNEEEIINGKGPNLLGKSAQKRDSQAAVGNRCKSMVCLVFAERTEIWKVGFWFVS